MEITAFKYKIGIFITILMLAFMLGFVKDNSLQFFTKDNENTLLNESIKELNGMSLKEVFEDNNLVNEISFQYCFGSYINGFYKLVGDGNYYRYSVVYSVSDVQKNDVYLHLVNFDIVDVPHGVNISSYQLGDDYYGKSLDNLSNNNYVVSSDYIFVKDGLSFFYLNVYFNSIDKQFDSVIWLKNMCVINLTELGLDSVSIVHLENLYNLYWLYKSNPTIVSYYKDNLSQEQKDNIGNFAIREFLDFFENSMKFLGSIGDFSIAFFKFFFDKKDGIIVRMSRQVFNEFANKPWMKFPEFIKWFRFGG